MLKRSFLMGALLLGISLLCAGGAKANTIGTLSLTGCGGGVTGCPDATYDFNIGTSSASLTITITGSVTTGVNDFIEGVDLGFTPSSNISGLSVTGPTDGGTVTWTSSASSLSNSGCGGNSGAFICASSTSNSGNGVPIVQNGVYTWTWNYNTISTDQISSDVHVGANYNPHDGLIVSQTVSVPEPGTVTLLFAGLLGLGLAGITRRRQVVCS